jgi:hypothetical protein
MNFVNECNVVLHGEGQPEKSFDDDLSPFAERKGRDFRHASEDDSLLTSRGDGRSCPGLHTSMITTLWALQLDYSPSIDSQHPRRANHRFSIDVLMTVDDQSGLGSLDVLEQSIEPVILKTEMKMKETVFRVMFAES